MSIAVRGGCGTTNSTYVAALLHRLIFYNYYTLLHVTAAKNTYRRTSRNEYCKAFLFNASSFRNFAASSWLYATCQPVNLVMNPKLSRSFWNFTNSLLDAGLPQHFFWYKMNNWGSESMHGAARQSKGSRVTLDLALVWKFLQYLLVVRKGFLYDYHKLEIIMRVIPWFQHYSTAKQNGILNVIKWNKMDVCKKF